MVIGDSSSNPGRGSLLFTKRKDALRRYGTTFSPFRLGKIETQTGLLSLVIAASLGEGQF